jgi:hypothetical protein
MKKLRHIAFMFAVVLGLAFSVSAQRDDQKRPPKDPPKVEPYTGPKQRPPKEKPPKDRPGKPGMAFIVTPTRDETFG